MNLPHADSRFGEPWLAAPIGIIANPHAGRDVRRLVSSAGSLTNHERAALVRRLLVGLRAAGAREVLYLPEQYGLVRSAVDGLEGIRVKPAISDPTFTPDDTLRATRAMVEAGVRALVSYGGDGTNRLVATATEGQPVALLPIAAGTNNVFPSALEATAAGFAAGVLSHWSAEEASAHACVEQHKRILVDVSEARDVALVDAALVRDRALGGRAVWDPSHVVAFMVTRAAPGCVGLSSLAGALCSIGPTEPRGAFAEMGSPGTTVAAIVAPGLILDASVRSIRIVAFGEGMEVGPAQGTITLDGERTLTVRGETVRFTLDAAGPWVVNVPATLRQAQAQGAFIVENRPGSGRD